MLFENGEFPPCELVMLLL